MPALVHCAGRESDTRAHCVAVLGESDLIYTSTLCALDSEKYENKEVLVLGGGDGGILYELLKLRPNHVLMAEV